MLEQALLTYDGPVALRLPRGGEGAYTDDSGTQSAVVLRQGTDITLVSYGILINRVIEAARLLEEYGIHAEIVKLNTITPIDSDVVRQSVRKTGALLVAEDCVEAGSVGQRLCAALARQEIAGKIVLVNSGSEFVTHGSIAQLEQQLGLDAESLCGRVREVLNRG